MYFERFCKSCKPAEHCCVFERGKGFTFVGIEDAERIKEGTGKGFDAFLDFSPLPENVKAQLGSDDPALEGSLRRSQLDRKGRILRLKRKEDGTCVFLDKGKCGIYPIRPNICRIYPFWAIRLIDGSLKVIEHDAEPRCPIVRSLRKEGDDVQELLSDRQVASVKAVFEDIEREDVSYRAGIKDFAQLIHPQ